MKKILITASKNSHITNFHTEYIDYLTKQGHIVDTATNGYVDYINISKSYHINYSKNIFSFKNILSIFKLVYIIRKNKYGLICTNSMLAGAVGRLAKILSLSKTKVLHISHGYLFNDNNSKKSKIYLSFEKLLSIVTNVLLVMNKDDLTLAYKYKLSKHIKFINGMGLKINTTADKTPKTLDIPKINNDKPFIFCCVGEFSKRKNQIYIIQSFNRIKTLCPNAKLLLAGEGATLNNCKNLSQYYGLDERVIFLGHYDNIQNVYINSNITISASLFEGLPFNLMESLYYNTPILVSNSRGNRDLCKNNINGLLFDLNTENDLSKKMELVYKNRNLYQELCTNSYLDKKYFIDNVKNDILSIYKELLEDEF